MAHERQAARTKVMYDQRLSFGARVLYYALDQHTGAKGVGWPKRSRLATKIGLSERAVARYLRELESLDYMVTTRRKYARVYTLSWITPEVTKLSPLGESRGDRIVTSEVTELSPLIKSVGSLNPSKEPKQQLLVPLYEERPTPEDRLLVGLDNRNLATDCYMATKVVQILGEASVDFFFRVLDQELERNFRLKEEFHLRHLSQVARAAASVWRSRRRIAPREEIA